MASFLDSVRGLFARNGVDALPVVGGPTEPLDREVWVLRLRHADGHGFRLELVSPHATQPIGGIHESFVATLATLPNGAEVPCRCTVPEGLPRNVVNLVAVGLAFEHDGVAPFATNLSDDVVSAHPELYLARASTFLTAHDEPRAVEAMLAAMKHEVEGVDLVWPSFSKAHREALRPALAEWLKARPVPDERAFALPPELWSDETLDRALSALHGAMRPVRLDPVHTFESVTAEAARRDGAVFAKWASIVEHERALEAASDPSQLRPALLRETLATRSSSALAVYADTLSEAGHVYGEFMALHLKGTKVALRQAKTLAGLSERAWLGALAAVLTDVRYTQGLPAEAAFTGALDAARFDQALEHPLLASFTKLVRKKTGQWRRSSVDERQYVRLLRAALPHALTEIDLSGETPQLLADVDTRRVTHVHDWRATESTLDPERFRAVKWVEVRVMPGTSLATLDRLAADRGGFFSALKPVVDLSFVGRVSDAELANVRSALPRLNVSELTINGEALGPALPPRQL